ncbi:MAG TPA: GNAT family N-acetyltransferase [Aggregatilineaceae bacterium]|nr:GNAT family N-acetyltransferase [Aggregatilineaceae bacterium]
MNVIRTATRDNAPLIYAIHKASLTILCTTHYSPDILQRWFATKTVEGYYPALDRGEMFMCECRDAIAGFGHAVPGEIEGIFVHPDFAGQGVGASLLDYAVARARLGHSGPIKVVATLNAQSFYEKHGFSPVKQYSISRADFDFPVVEMSGTFL